MSLVKKNDGLRSWRSMFSDFFESEHLYDDFFNKSMVPAVNVKDDGKEYLVEVAAPGMEKDDFNITIENGLLCISAECKDEKEEKEENYTRKEFNYQSFQRSFTLPEDANEEDIHAKYKRGVLKIKLTKKELGAEKHKKMIAIE
ncbi:MAG: Hsp20/alpha crystallin family protein [Cyclobacteriaceae bacterium]|nr:Hsp20/alpha crystallin family protein [Cyclobacteriaceae bacterium]